jgi:hypothetical protein
MMAYIGLSPSESWMRADSHDGLELRLHTEAEYIDAALTFIRLPTSSCNARPDHTSWHIRDLSWKAAILTEADPPEAQGISLSDP